MDKKLALKWAEALESGKFKQCRKRLHNDGEYCCLGVLSTLIARKKAVRDLGLRWTDGMWERDDAEYFFNLPSDIRLVIGMSLADTDAFVGMNDKENADFPTIAAKVRSLYGLPPREGK